MLKSHHQAAAFYGRQPFRRPDGQATQLIAYYRNAARGSRMGGDWLPWFSTDTATLFATQNVAILLFTAALPTRRSSAMSRCSTRRKRLTRSLCSQHRTAAETFSVGSPTGDPPSPTARFGSVSAARRRVGTLCRVAGCTPCTHHRVLARACGVSRAACGSGVLALHPHP